MGRHRRRLLVVERPPRDLLPPHRGHSRRLGHRGQRPGHGLWQHGRRFGDRRRLHPQPGDRRQQVLRRVAGQRPGRGRGGGHPHPQPAQRGHQERSEPAPAVAAEGDARGLRAALRHPQPARGPLPRHAGHRVHHPGRAPVDAADPDRQADRHRGPQHGHGHAV